MFAKRVVFLVSVLLSLSVGASAQTNWKARLKERLPLMGHRNWVVIVDSAYPLQSSAGIETIYTGDEQLAVVKTVLAELKKQKHVRANVFLDQELKFLTDRDARGIERYRKDLNTLLKGASATAMLHEKIIGKLDEAGKTFNVLVLKTNLTLPYTSVFLQLDCGYWSANKENALRKKMGGK